jgi:hypothetical protein
MVYDMPERAKQTFGIQKRQRQMDRSRQYIAQVGATWVIPSAGPPCFLDPELRQLNDDHGDPANIFPDQMVFLDQLRRNGHDHGLLMMPGSTAGFVGSQLDSHQHPLPTELVEAIFTSGKADYIAGSRKGPLGTGHRRFATRTTACGVRAGHAGRRRDLRRHRLPRRACARVRCKSGKGRPRLS